MHDKPRNGSRQPGSRLHRDNGIQCLSSHPKKQVPGGRLDHWHGQPHLENACTPDSGQPHHAMGSVTATAHQEKAKKEIIKDSSSSQPPYPLSVAENVLPRSATRGLLTKLCKRCLGKVGEAALQEEQSGDTRGCFDSTIQVPSACVPCVHLNEALS